MDSIFEKRKDMVDKIIAFIQYKTKESSASGAVIGLSGGIDSTLTAYLTVMALGHNNVLGILLPDNNVTTKHDIDDAMEVVNTLNINHRLIDISNIVQRFSLSISDFDKTNLIPNGNIKARIRMSVLYYYANMMNRIVVGTGNKTELLLGYFTKYGDGGVDIEPIGDLYKTQVREISWYLKIPSKIIDKVPTAGLWPGQTDEEDLGISYETIDKILAILVDEEKDVSIVKNMFKPKYVDKLLGLMHTNEHKRISVQSCKLEMINQ